MKPYEHVERIRVFYNRYIDGDSHFLTLALLLAAKTKHVDLEPC